MEAIRVNFTRREVLAAFLGLPAALAACRTNTEPRLPVGEIVGPSQGIGHHIRDGFNVIPAADAWQQTGVLIVGILLAITTVASFALRRTWGGSRRGLADRHQGR